MDNLNFCREKNDVNNKKGGLGCVSNNLKYQPPELLIKMGQTISIKALGPSITRDLNFGLRAKKE